MRNLKHIQHSAHYLQSDLPLVATVWDTATDSLVCAFGPSRLKKVIELKKTSAGTSNEEPILIASWDAECPLPDLEVDEVLNLQHSGHSEKSCLVLAGGDIIVVREQPLPGEEKIEIVGSVDAGITAAAWSPDEDLLVVTTRANTLLFITADFDIAATISFLLEDAMLSKHVNVGWGKSETQFKGKRVKALRDPTMPEKVDKGTLSSHDRKQVTISWRGDGAFLAVNTIEEAARRMIRVYSREGTLDSVSEPVDGLEGALTWRPSGNLIAGLQRLDEKVNVIFFERNGLRHGQFGLRLSVDDQKQWASAIDLQWNIDSSTLAVCFQGKVQLWTIGNYHYYLKQDIPFSSARRDSCPLLVAWHPEEPLRIALLERNTHHPGRAENSSDHSVAAIYTNALHTVHFSNVVAGGSTIAPHDFGTTAVIDGRQYILSVAGRANLQIGILKLSPLRKANIPPPMALHNVELASNIKDVAINFSSSHIATLHETAIAILVYDVKALHIIDPIVERTITLPVSDTLTARQICFRGDVDLFILVTHLVSGVDMIYDVQKSSFHSPSSIMTLLRIFPTLDHDALCVSSSTAVARIDLLEPTEGASYGAIMTVNICSYPTPVSWVEVLNYADQSIAIGLTPTGALYANERQLLRNCTSFLVTEAHLIATTTHHLLKFIHLGKVSDLDVPSDKPETDERCRSLERGAKLVMVMPTSFSLTLQLPRGNLETIYPRALVLASIRQNITAKDYKSAFLTCRSQRVDMNILHDHAPKQFLANVELFINQLNKVEYIDLFLSQLREDNVASNMYRETLPQVKENGHPLNGVQMSIPRSDPESSKVNRLCDAFLHVLQKRHGTNLQNVITATVCKVPPDIKAGLAVIANLREKQANLAEKAVEHICFLADVNQIYEQALGLYDLDLTLLVAQQSQKDPREYLPYLQSLQRQSQLRRQYTIDNDLAKYPKALQHLYSMGDLKELKSYMIKHELYREALELHRYDSERQASILRCYADFLSRSSRFKEAGIAYESLSDHSAACEAYRAANLWQECLSSATFIPLPLEEISSLAKALADGLVESKDYSGAARIYLDYLADVEAATRHCCTGYHFAEAIRIVTLHRRAELLESTVDPGLVEASAALTELLADCKSQLGAQVPRLRELRLKKAEDPLAFFEGTEATDIPDNVSLAPSDTSTSGATFLTRYTNRASTVNTDASRKTSKNRRREERKRARGKKGSVYEEEYLVNSVERLVERVNSVNNEVQRTVEGLLRRSMRERARAVERAMCEVVDKCLECLGEVFEVERKMDLGDEAGEAYGRPPGADGVYFDSLEDGKRKREPPALKPFLRSELLNA